MSRQSRERGLRPHLRRQCSSGELDGVAVRLLHAEHGLDLVLEGKVERLGGEVTEAVGQVASPEGKNSYKGMGREKMDNFSLERPISQCMAGLPGRLLYEKFRVDVLAVFSVWFWCVMIPIVIIP